MERKHDRRTQITRREFLRVAGMALPAAFGAACAPRLVDTPPGISGPSRLVFIAQSRWLRQHPLDPRVYVSGFQILSMEPSEKRAFEQIYAQCEPVKAGRDAMPDYLWKD